MSARDVAAGILRARCTPGPLGWPPAWRQQRSTLPDEVVGMHARHVAWVRSLPADHPLTPVWTPPADTKETAA